MPPRLGKIQSGAGSLRQRSNGRRLSAVGAILIVLGALPAWWTLGGGAGGLPAITGNAFDSPGALGFFAALALLAILIAPDAVGEPLRFDWWPVHLALISLAALGFLLAAYGAAVTATGSDLSLSTVFSPTRAPGLWITLVGLGAWISGVAQIVDARDDR
ncbi:MAG: hypothetical protein NTV67_01490 [Chloroflexi bacterium]|nr:hypothetical protein [Chloroflexota bacterium]